MASVAKSLSISRPSTLSPTTRVWLTSSNIKYSEFTYPRRKSLWSMKCGRKPNRREVLKCSVRDTAAMRVLANSHYSMKGLKWISQVRMPIWKQSLCTKETRAWKFHLLSAQLSSISKALKISLWLNKQQKTPKTRSLLNLRTRSHWLITWWPKSSIKSSTKINSLMNPTLCLESWDEFKIFIFDD